MAYKTDELAERIRAARQAAGLSQRALSVKAGVTQSQVSQFESGTHEPRLSKLIDLARALDLEVVLVPRKMMPAVTSIVRAAEPERDSPTFALGEIERAERLLRTLRAAQGSSAVLDRMADTLRFFRHAPVRAAEVAAIGDGADRLKGQPSADTLAEVAAEWTSIRNRLAHGRAEAPRPAYAVADEDDA